MVNVAPFDEKPKGIYARQQRNLAKAMEPGEFVLVSMEREAPMAYYTFLWESSLPLRQFDHEAFGFACRRLQAALSGDGMLCRFLNVEYQKKGLPGDVRRNGVRVYVEVAPTMLEWPVGS